MLIGHYQLLISFSLHLYQLDSNLTKFDDCQLNVSHGTFKLLKFKVFHVKHLYLKLTQKRLTGELSPISRFLIMSYPCRFRRVIPNIPRNRLIKPSPSSVLVVPVWSLVCGN